MTTITDTIDYHLQYLVEQAGAKNIRIDADDVSYSVGGGQGDGLAFDATMELRDAVAAANLSDEYLPLKLAVAQFGCAFSVRRGRYGRGVYFSDDVNTSNVYNLGNDTTPDGVFADMGPEEWGELIDEQWNAVEDAVVAAFLDTAKDLAHAAYEAIVEEYEYLTSEVYFIEDCNHNDSTLT